MKTWWALLLTLFLVACDAKMTWSPSGPPTGLNAVAGDRQVTLSWNPPTGGATSYNIYWSTTSGVTKSTGLNISNVTSPFVHTGLTNGTMYYYVVTAVVDTESPESAQVSARPLYFLTPPAAPAGLTAAPADGQVTISWNGDSTAPSYNIYWSMASGVTKSTGTKISNVTSPYIHTGLTNGMTYYYVVTAVNSAGESADSAEVSATPAAAVALPAAPTGVMVKTTGSGQATISWNPVSGAQSYNIYWSFSSDVSKSTGTKITNVTNPYDHSGLTNGLTYYYVVTAVNEIGESAESVVCHIIAGDDSLPLPDPPSGVSAAPHGLHENIIRWDNVNGATSYNIYWSTASVVTKATGTRIENVTSPYVHTGLKTGTTYYYVVTAVSKGGESNESSPVVSAMPSNRYLMGGSVQGTSLEFTIVSTIAGTAGSAGSTDAVGTDARFFSPYGITTDGENLYVADYSNHTIRKMVTASGVVSTLAGTAGAPGSANGTGANARFNNPAGITTDGINLYVTDNANHTIRKIVISTGVVSTLAGTAGQPGSANGTGSDARFFNPVGITTDGINLYVADTANHTIRKIVISTGEVSTLAGLAGSFGSDDGNGSSARFYNPMGITTDGTNLYVADWSYSTIRKIVIATGDVSTWAGSPGTYGSAGGSRSAASFNYPCGITTDGWFLYVTDYYNNTIRIIDPYGNVGTLAGSAGQSGSADGDGLTARFSYPIGITMDGNSLLVTDFWNQTIRRIQ